MSYWNVPDGDYHEAPAGTPGWQFAPVPGWGKNPLRAGPSYVGVGAAYEPGIVPTNQAVLPRYASLGCPGGCGAGVGQAEADSYVETTWGHVMLGIAGGIAAGVLFGYAWWKGEKR